MTLSYHPAVVQNHHSSQYDLFSAAPDTHRRKLQTFLDMNPLLKRLTTTYLGYGEVTGWMGRYKLHTAGKNWFEAQEVCTQEGANLLVINSHKEAEAVRSLVEQFGFTRNYYWIGFHDIYEEGNFVTIFSKCFNDTFSLQFV